VKRNLCDRRVAPIVLRPQFPLERAVGCPVGATGCFTGRQPSGNQGSAANLLHRCWRVIMKAEFGSLLVMVGAETACEGRLDHGWFRKVVQWLQPRRRQQLWQQLWEQLCGCNQWPGVPRLVVCWLKRVDAVVCRLMSVHADSARLSPGRGPAHFTFAVCTLDLESHSAQHDMQCANDTAK
jgi:hypothetical protein